MFPVSCGVALTVLAAVLRYFGFAALADAVLGLGAAVCGGGLVAVSVRGAHTRRG
jgi:hypothetical protein